MQAVTLPAAPPATDSLVDWALWWAACGVPVLPLHPREKAPYLSRDKVTGKAWAGYLSATTDPEIIARWWETYPGSNIGGEMSERSGLLALDVDPRSGGRDSLAQLCRGYGDLPASVKQITGRGDGGFHLIMRRPEGVTDFYGELAPGLELKTKGYIVLSPSVHPDTGQRYILAPDCAPHEVTYAAPPDWMDAMMIKPASVTAPIEIPEGGYAPDDRYASAAMRAEVEALAATRDNRNVRLNRAAYCLGQFVAAGRLARATVFNALWAACEANGLLTDPDDGPDKTRSTINRGLDDGAKEPRTTAAVPASTPEAEAPPHPGEDAHQAQPRTIPWLDLEGYARNGIPKPDYLLDGWLTAGDIALFVGAAGQGKSTTVAGLALALANGKPFCGLAVTRPCRVLVADEEQGPSDTARTLLRLGAPHPNVRALSMAGVRISNSDGRALLRSAIEEFRPDVAVLDSCTQVFGLANENDSSEVADRFAVLFELREDFGVAFVLVHHRPKEMPGQSRPAIDMARGSTAFATQSSTVWICKRVSREALDLEMAKRRGGELASTVRITYSAEPDGPITLTGETVDEGGDLDRLADDIVDYLAGRDEASTGQIVKAVPQGTARPSGHRRGVSRALAELVRMGAVLKVARGRWKLANPTGETDATPF